MRRIIIAGLFLLSSLYFTSCSSSKNEFLEDQINIDENPISENELLRLVNEVRASGTTCGDTYYPPVGELSWNTKLEQAGLNHSQDMLDNDFFEHTSSDGRNLTDRLNEVGYNYSYAGENIAYGYTTENAVINGWLNSQGHCANIMNPNFTEMGVGRVGNYWTQDFGKPKQ